MIKHNGYADHIKQFINTTKIPTVMGENKEKFQCKCVSLKGDLAWLGKHILMPGGVTLCGCPIVDYDKKQFPILQSKELTNFPSEYTIEEWDITCPRCLEITDMLDAINKGKQSEQN